eukprot:TRINITY_DN67769_c10_g1_i1.p1 TRINITY_DN67769_c10_g1~~TRINITY_DN67769_c10_g1_i1.p1  ORF type:complete len:292 (+),score=1.37 TRINITY_DN67769_c10_g1_i1:23-898(+)
MNCTINFPCEVSGNLSRALFEQHRFINVFEHSTSLLIHQQTLERTELDQRWKLQYTALESKILLFVTCMASAAEEQSRADICEEEKATRRHLLGCKMISTEMLKAVTSTREDPDGEEYRLPSQWHPDLCYNTSSNWSCSINQDHDVIRIPTASLRGGFVPHRDAMLLAFRIGCNRKDLQLLLEEHAPTHFPGLHVRSFVLELETKYGDGYIHFVALYVSELKKWIGGKSELSTSICGAIYGLRCCGACDDVIHFVLTWLPRSPPTLADIECALKEAEVSKGDFCARLVAMM